MFPRKPWPKLYSELSQSWSQGEHVCITAPTGRGKTVLLQSIMPIRSHVVFFGTKIHDDEYTRMRRTGWKRATQWPPPPWQKRTMLWPYPERTIAATQEKQREVFAYALDQIFLNGRRTVALDELHWMANELKLYREIAAVHHQGRSSKLTLLDGFQRPAYVPRIVYSSATHMFIWGTNDPTDIKQVAQFGNIPKRVLETELPTLGKYEFIYFNTRDVNATPVRSQVSR